MTLTTRRGALSSQAFGQFALKSNPPVFLSSANAQGSGSTVVIAMPTGTVQGNLMICIITNADGHTYTPPSGWSSLIGASGGALNTISFYKIAGVSESGPYTFTIDTGTDTATTGLIVTYKNIASGIDSKSSLFTYSAGGNSQTIPAITVNNPGRLLVLGACFTAAMNAPSGFTLQAQVHPYANGYCAVFDELSSSGSTGSVSFSTAGTDLTGALVNIY